jgi:hypothetical protein
MGTPSETKSFEEVRGRVYQRACFYTGYKFVSMTAVTQGKASAYVESIPDKSAHDCLLDAGKEGGV